MLLSAIARRFINFCGPTVDFGTFIPAQMLPDRRYQRWCFSGFTVSLQMSTNNVDFHEVLSADLSGGLGFSWSNAFNFILTNWRANLNYPPFVPVGEPLGPQLLSREGFIPMVDAVNGDTLKLVVEMEQFGEPLQIEHYFRRTNTEGVPLGSDASLVAEWAATPQTALLACVDVSVALKKYRAEWRIQGVAATLPRTYLQNADPVVFGGANGGDPNADASQLSYLISWYTNFAGRGERGRTNVPGTSHPFIVANRLTPDAITTLKVYADTLLSAFNGDTDLAKAWQLVLWRQHFTNPALVPGDDGEYANPLNTAVPPSVAEWPGHDEEGKPIYVHPPTTKPPFSPAAAQHAITLAVVQDKVHTQRRRGPGVRISRRSPRTR